MKIKIVNNLKFDSVLLFALVVPFIMGYRIGSDETPYLLFGFIFLLLIGYAGLDLVNLPRLIFEKLKLVILWLTIVTVIGSGFVSAIIVRHQTAPIYMIHDIIIQQEVAIRYVLHGKNPYKETYFGTPLEQWHYDEKEVNPALYHFVMEPFYLLFAIPFYFVSNILFGYFDARMPLLFLFFIVLSTASLLVKEQEKKRLFLLLLAFHPSMLPYTLEGRSDMFMYAFLLVGWALLFWKKEFLSGISLGLACAVKQSAWPFIPFYAAYVFYKKRSLRKTIISLAPFLITFVIVTLPFLLWDPKNFYESTIAYLSGSTAHSYPISGYGLGSVLLQLGVIKDKFAYYPFVIWQIVVCLPLLVVFLWFLRSHLTVRNMIVSYALFLFIFWYMSRYFNNSHIAFVSYILIAAY
ncbi:MAG: glycosyltransferase family 87 protein, partial [bacterium]|nr:glycosyltransferase family 87 protein [bacterium]